MRDEWLLTGYLLATMYFLLEDDEEYVLRTNIEVDGKTASQIRWTQAFAHIPDKEKTVEHLGRVLVTTEDGSEFTFNLIWWREAPGYKLITQGAHVTDAEKYRILSELEYGLKEQVRTLLWEKKLIQIDRKEVSPMDSNRNDKLDELLEKYRDARNKADALAKSMEKLQKKRDPLAREILKAHITEYNNTAGCYRREIRQFLRGM